MLAAAPRPMPIVVKTAATPMIIPSMVKMARNLWVKLLSRATCKYLIIFMGPLQDRLGQLMTIVCIAHNLAITQRNDPLGPLGHLRVVCDHNNSQPLSVQFIEERQHFGPGFGIQR